MKTLSESDLKHLGVVQAHWIAQYEEKRALWIHDGNPKRPHALLTSGKHSNGFFNSRLVIPDEALLRAAANDLMFVFAMHGGEMGLVDGVAGPQTGATKLAEFISDEIIAGTRRECFWVSPAKSESEGKKTMVFSADELKLLPGKSLLLGEDVLSTGGSVDRTAEAVINAGGKVLPYVLVLVNRSGLTEINGRKIIALINHDMPMWEHDACKLCPQGSKAVHPKDTVNWNLLNAYY